MLRQVLLVAILWSCCGEDNFMYPVYLEGSTAKCLDGSTSGYFFRKGSDSGANSFVIHFEGGGLCFDKKTCAERLLTRFGTSLLWPDHMIGDGPVSAEQVLNPDFYNFNHVFIPYCSGDLHSGTMLKPSLATLGLLFGGHHTVSEVLADLLARRGLGNATDVLLSGDSAGALGAALHTSMFKEALGDVPLRLTMQAAWFMNIKPFRKIWPTLGEVLTIAVGLWKSFVPPGCDAKKKFECLLPVIRIDRIVQDVPTFVAQAIYDGYQLLVQAGVPLIPSDESVVFTLNVGDELLKSLSSTPVISAPNGLFATCCESHVFDYQSIRINGTSYQQALGDWYFQRAADVHLVDTCRGPGCSSACPVMDAPRSVAADALAGSLVFEQCRSLNVTSP